FRQRKIAGECDGGFESEASSQPGQFATQRSVSRNRQLNGNMSPQTGHRFEKKGHSLDRNQAARVKNAERIDFRRNSEPLAGIKNIQIDSVFTHAQHAGTAGGGKRGIGGASRAQNRGGGRGAAGRLVNQSPK